MSEQRVVRAGDIYLLDLDPTRGSEQSGVRPVLVISADAMNFRSRRMIICPITNNISAWATKVPLPAGCKTSGMVLTDQLRSVDRHARILRHVETVSSEFVMLVRSYVGRLLELEIRTG